MHNYLSRTHVVQRSPAHAVPATGVFKNYNTIEEFKAADKTALFNAVTDDVRSQLPSLAQADIHLDLAEHHRRPLDDAAHTLPVDHLRRPEEVQVLLLVRVPRLRC